MKTKFERLDDFKYVHYLLVSHIQLLVSHIQGGGGFKIDERSRIKFDETKPEIDISCIEVGGLKIGDFVNVQSTLASPWDTDVDKTDRVSGELQIVSFVRLQAKVRKVQMYDTFCVLRKEIDGAGPSPRPFVMTGKNQDKIALYFINTLEKVEE